MDTYDIDFAIKNPEKMHDVFKQICDFAGKIAFHVDGCDKEKTFGEVVEDTTNNIMELNAVIYALSKVKNKTIPTEVTTDSQYVVMGVTDWSKKWIENGWRNAKNKPIENQGLWRYLLDLVSQFNNIAFINCSGHSDNAYNNRVDHMCNDLMDIYLREKK